MWDDPIIQETRSIRDKIASRFGYDVHALGEYFMKMRANDAKLLIEAVAESEKDKLPTPTTTKPARKMRAASKNIKAVPV